MRKARWKRKPKKTEEGSVLVFWSCCNKYHKLDDLNKRNLFPQNSKGRYPRSNLELLVSLRYLSFNFTACELSNFSCVRLFVTPWTVAARFLCPWDSPGKNIGVGCQAFLQGIFPIQGQNPCLFHLLHWQEGSLPLAWIGKSLNFTMGLLFQATSCGGHLYRGPSFNLNYFSLGFRQRWWVQACQA